LSEVRKYFLSGDLNQRSIAILTLLDSGYHDSEAFRLMRAFDGTLTQDAWDLMVRDARILDGIRKRPRLGRGDKPA
jgi:sulfite reductase beta subunit-like hemoprotein